MITPMSVRVREKGGLAAFVVNLNTQPDRPSPIPHLRPPASPWTPWRWLIHSSAHSLTLSCLTPHHSFFSLFHLFLLSLRPQPLSGEGYCRLPEWRGAGSVRSGGPTAAVEVVTEHVKGMPITPGAGDRRGQRWGVRWRAEGRNKVWIRYQLAGAGQC